jgi:hypothetical protein
VRTTFMPETSGVAVVVNVRSARACGEIRRALDEGNVTAKWYLVTSPSAARRAARRAVSDGYTDLVLAGGHRTVASATRSLVSSGVAINVFPNARHVPVPVAEVGGTSSAVAGWLSARRSSRETSIPASAAASTMDCSRSRIAPTIRATAS